MWTEAWGSCLWKIKSRYQCVLDFVVFRGSWPCLVIVSLISSLLQKMSLNDVKKVKICNSSDLILKKILYARTQKTSSEYTNYDVTHIKEYSMLNLGNWVCFLIQRFYKFTNISNFLDCQCTFINTLIPLSRVNHLLMKSLPIFFWNFIQSKKSWFLCL